MFEFSYNFNSNDIHSLHPYPAKFPASVPYQLLKELSKPNDVILDPFCGSGTTLVEGLSFNCNVIGNDINYIALLISLFVSLSVLGQNNSSNNFNNQNLCYKKKKC